MKRQHLASKVALIILSLLFGVLAACDLYGTQRLGDAIRVRPLSLNGHVYWWPLLPQVQAAVRSPVVMCSSSIP